jgi:hypothetical protein
MAISPALLINLKEHPRLSMEWKGILQVGIMSQCSKS